MQFLVRLRTAYAFPQQLVQLLLINVTLGPDGQNLTQDLAQDSRSWYYLVEDVQWSDRNRKMKMPSVFFVEGLNTAIK